MEESKDKQKSESDNKAAIEISQTQFVNRYGVAIKKIKKIYIPEYTKKRDGVANLEPKVNEPFELIPRRIPRATVIDSLRKLFSSVKIEELLRKQNIDFSKPDFNRSKLDLHHFDDKAYEIYPNEYWLGKCLDDKGRGLKLPGVALFFDQNNRVGEWKKVLISEYDNVQDIFIGNTDDSQKTLFKKHKLLILFDAENPFVYAKRVMEAINRREIAENRIKYNFFLSKIPKIDKQNDLPENRKTKILNLIANTRDLSLVEETIAEEIMNINNSYFITLNKLMFDNLYFNRQTAELCVGDLRVKQDPHEPIPQYAKEKVPYYDFNDIATRFGTKYLLCKNYIIDVLNEIKENSNKMIEEMNLFKLNFNNTIKIDEFKKAEKNHFTTFKNKIEQEKIGEIKKILRKISLKTEDDHFEIDFVVKKMQKKRKCVFEEDKRKERYVEVLMQEINKHKTSSFINLINSIVKDALYSLVCKSIVSFMMFFENLIPVSVRVNSANEVINNYDTSFFKKLKNISQSKINLILPNAFNKVTDCPDRDLNNTVDVEETYSTSELPHKFPIFHLTIMYKDNHFEYSYKIEDLINEVKKTFDDGLDKVQKIQQIFVEKEGSSHYHSFFKLIHRHKPVNVNSLIPPDPNENFKQKEMDWVDEIYDRLGTTLHLGKEPLDQYLTTFESYKEYFNFNVEQYVKYYDEDKTDPNINNKIRDDIVKFQNIRDKFQKEIPESIQVSFFLVNCKEIRDTLIRLFDKIIELEIGLLDKNAKELKTSINKSIDDIKKDITKTGKNIDEIVAIERYIEDVPGMLESIKLEIDNCLSIYKILDDFHSKSSYGDIRARLMLLNGPTSVLDTISGVKQILAKQREKFLEELDDNQAKLKEDMIILDKNVKSLMNFDNISNLAEASQLARNLENNFVDYKEKVKIFNNREVYFGREPTDHSKLGEMYKEFEPFFQIWTNSDTFLNKKKVWLSEDFSNLKGEEVKTVNENVMKNITMSIKKLKDKGLDRTFDKVIKIAEDMKRQTEEFKPISNLAVFLTTEGLTDRHWNDLKNVGIDCVSNREGLTLEKIVANIKNNNDGKIPMEVINQAGIIADKASRENQISQKLEVIENKWKDVNFQLVPYRIPGMCTIGGWGDIYQILDEDVMEVQQLEVSQFKGPFVDVISDWSNALLTITNVLEEWKRFQQKWMQLQPIFDSNDIHKNIPGEAKKFAASDRFFRDLIKTMKDKENQNVKVVATRKDLLENMIKNNQQLEDVERGLNDYIEKKKAIFPRFYFISNEDLIEILSQTKDLNKIKENLKKIFESIHYIEVKDEKVITKMLSNLKEEVALKDHVVLYGKNVEVWMGELEQSMFITVKNCLDKAIKTYLNTKREIWIFEHPGQCIMHSQQVHWSSQVDNAIKQGSVEEYLTQTQERINLLVALIRGNLNRVDSITIGNMITLEVHNKEVVQSLIDFKITEITSFEWIKQLRYYWENSDCYIRSIQTSFPYGYEYLGNTEILVITPLTDKCYLTLMGALKLNMGGAPAGPAGTGKTESTKDLAKAIAKQCIVYNCSEDTDFNIVAKFFKGLACCGAWICFDEFNRIHIEVLSVIASQLIILFGAKNDGIYKIIFEKSEIRILPTFCVFITMNPDYEGRTALPDNLNALFRPMAMMVPDYKLISEVYLYSSGYMEASDLAKKIVATFKLSSEQLSTQSHYDFGMRAVKSVLYAARKLKRSSVDTTENQLLLRSLQDVNVPKFLKEDIELFKYIIKDLFPGVERPKTDLDNLIEKIKENCVTANLQPEEPFIQKIIQLYDTIQVRHGLMIVGPTGGGKTSNYKMLQKSLSDLHDGVKFFKTETTIINPKSIRMEQLYCEKDPNTMEWINGIIPLVVQNINRENNSKMRYWVMFDGPVDTLWIENMNSVLDDSRKLCLSSSAIIVLNETITMMFEVEDLTFASPATVSRCGMVFMEPSAIGLMPHINSWMNKNIPPNLLKGNFDIVGKLKKLFNEFLESSVYFTRKKIKEPCPTVNISLTNSLLRILDCFLEKYREKEGYKVSDIDIEILHNCLPQIFVYSVIWSIGITTNEDGRNKFNAFIRETIDKFNYPVEVKIPEDGSAYDFFFDLDRGAWIKWESMLSYPILDNKALYTDIFVPTVDSVRYSSLIKLLILNNKHLIATGPTGTGKTINIMDIIGKGVGDKYLSLVINFSAQTSANQTQETIDSKLKKKTRVLYAPENNKQMIIFFDDLNMPKKEKYEAQPPIELLRQWLDHKGWYDLKDKERQFMNIINLIFVGAMGPPGGGRSFLTQRFMRHFNLITYTELIDSSIKSIFERKVSHFLFKYSDAIKDIIPSTVFSTLTLYRQIKFKLLPTPKNPHYLFNLRDMSKVLQGVCSASMKHTTEKIHLIRLWIHEMTRAFGDRLISEEDRNWLKDILETEAKSTFSCELEDIYSFGKKIIFCDFINVGDRLYSQVTNVDNFIKKVEEYLYEYNMESKGKPMNLVMFLDACDHVARICRILRSTQGHALLLGVGGSGRQSLARLATYINRYDLYQIEVIKGYTMADFKKNIKECLKIAGKDEKPISFLICDTQIFNELILEDLNNALNSGDVPEIYKADDIEEIRQACRSECSKNKLPETWTNIFNIYLNRVRTNIHIIIAMSPIGDVFSTRLRMFPCLVNCCTIDWFTEWPDEALESVAADKITTYNLDLGDSFKGCVQSIKYMHKSVEKISILYQSELRRYNYLTPTSFLEFLLLYKTILESKRKESNDNISRYEMGLKVLAFAGEEIEKIEKDITVIKPQLEETTIIVEKTLKEVEINKAVADKVSAEAEKERKTAEEMNIQCTALDKQAQETLASTQKELEESINKVNEIKDPQLKTLAAIQAPSKPMQKFMNFLLFFFCGESWKKKAYQIPNSDFSKKEIEYNVLSAAKTELNMLNSADFKHLFFRYTDEEERNKLKNKDFKKVQLAEEFLKDFTREEAFKGCSDIVGCFDFIVAMIDFVHKSIDVVDPLKEQAGIFREKKKDADIKLRESEIKFKAANDEKMRLEKDYNENVKKKNDLAFEISECQTKLERAKSLIVLLSGEKKRWADSVEELKKNSLNLIGDCLYSAGMIAYSGAFTMKYRSDLAALWKHKLDDEKILRSPEVSLRFIMEDKLQTRKWNLCSLPNDDLSVENGIIIFKTRKWPLMIDPQNQAASFIKKYGPEVRVNSFLTVKITDPKMVDQVISSVKFGNWILLDNVGINLDTSLEPVLLQQKIQKGQYFEIKIGDKTLPYNDDFKLFMITNLSNPHYSPETFAKITIINFAITLQGLEEQMLSELVKIEMPELEETKNKILEENFKASEILKEIEDKILDSLSKNKDNIQEILKTSDLIDILTEAKFKAKEINEKLIESEKTSIEIQSKRENYRPSAKRSSILFFTLLDLSFIDPMYQYSLMHFKKLYESTIRLLSPTDDIETRIKDINFKSTKDFYDFTCRSLFERDKLLFSFCLTVKILMAEIGDSELSQMELRFFLAGPPGDLEFKLPENPTNWISSNEWPTTYAQIYGMTKISEKLKDFESFFMKNHSLLKPFFESPKNENTPLPEPWESSLTYFQKLIVIKAIRADKITASISFFVENKLGKEFTEPPTFELEKSYKDSNSGVPLLFILVTGSDPVNDFKNFAELKNKKYEFVSLGKSMDKIALSKIEEMKAKGAWILLQNCHLAISFMSKLEEVIEQLQINTSIDPGFRLWMTSMSSPNFSINILKNSIKITMEPPKGLKPNLLRQYGNIKDQDLEACSKPDLFKTFFFSMCFFHAIIQDRRKFGPIGWNVRYEFTNEDLIVSRKQLKNFLEEYDEVPYKVINYLGAEINYGGRVTDDKDQRLIRTILKSFLTPDILKFEDYKFSSSDKYYCPQPGDRNSYIEYIKTLPSFSAPEIFGLHDNAEITTAQNEASLLLETVLGMQPRTTSGSGKSVETVIKEIVITVENSTPKPFDYESTFALYPTDYNESMNTVLIQEVIRYNNLLNIMKKHIKTLKKALSGRIVMSEEMERISTSLYNNQVPQLWIKFGFLSLKPLMSWLNDLKERIAFFQGWIDNGTPKAFCLPRFSFPQAFLTGTLQNFSRKYTVAIDLLSFEFKILDMLNPNNVREKPQDGCYVFGMFIEGARWNYSTHRLDISKNRELYTDVPLIHMIPVKNRVIPTTGIYQCPLYKVLTRQGTLSTTGHSTNFVLYVELPSNESDTVWIKAGVAMFLALKS